MSLPSRRDRFRPLELILIAAGLAIVAALVVVMVSRDLKLGLITVAGFALALLLFAGLSALAETLPMGRCFCSHPMLHIT